MKLTRKNYVGARHVGEEAICVEGLSFAYPDGQEALRDVHLHVLTGSTLAVIGPNGAGKTTLLKILLGLLGGYQGKVLTAGLPPRQARRAGGIVGWVPQRSRMTWNFPATVQQVVKMGLVGKTGLLRMHSREDLDYAGSLLDLLEISDIALRPIGDISGGQQQRALIARALAARPAVLMLDEPTVGVDEAGQQAFLGLMRQIKEKLAVTLVIVTHDLRAVLPEVQQVACLNRTLHFHDIPSRLTADVLGAVFRCDLTGLFPTAAPGAGDDGHGCGHDHDHGHDHGPAPGQGAQGK
jgi:zinc transport system ATP-binding protein